MSITKHKELLVINKLKKLNYISKFNELYVYKKRGKSFLIENLLQYLLEM